MSTAIKERPVLFSGPMVRAILAGRKTQTRRVVKGVPPEFCRTDRDLAPIVNHSETLWAISRSRLNPEGGAAWPPDPQPGFACPYGRIGDRLRISEEVTVTAIAARRCKVWYAADGESVIRFADRELYEKIKSYKRPRLRGVHLPAAYARDVRLEITGVRVERLNEISEDDAKAEGVEPGCLTCGENCFDRGGCGCCRPSYRDSFIWLWESINGEGSWAANPWVWVVEFKRLESAP